MKSILSIFILFSLCSAQAQTTHKAIWECYSSYYDSLNINIKSELNKWEDHLIETGFLKDKTTKSFIDFIDQGIKDRMFAWYTDCRSQCTYKTIALSIDKHYQNGEAVECMWDNLKNSRPEDFEKIEEDYNTNLESNNYTPTYFASLTKVLGKEISKPGYKYPLLEATYRLSFDRIYLVIKEERELGLDPKEIHGSPTLVMQTILEAAKTEDFSKLKFLCDPYEDSDGDVRIICNIAEQPEQEREEFITAFKNAKITGEPRKKGKKEAEVPFIFKPRPESMRMVRRGEWWFLKSF